jgi:flagellar biosynthesis protein FlhA
VIVGEGEAFPGMHLAINPGGITTPLIGTATTDPAFGLPAHWIDDKQKDAAQMAGFTVVDSETVMATHLSHLMQVQASKLLSRTETQQLVEHVARSAPKLIEEVIPKMVPIAVFQKVLQLLLDEAVHIRDMRTIIESLAEHAASVTDPVDLARRVRVALSPAIVQQIYGPSRELNVIAIDPALERLLVQALGNSSGPALDPGVADMLTRTAAEVAMKQEEIGLPACLLVPDQIRNSIARLVRRVAPRLQVLAHSEIPETHTIRIGPILRGATP